MTYGDMGRRERYTSGIEEEHRYDAPREIPLLFSLKAKAETFPEFRGGMHGFISSGDKIDPEDFGDAENLNMY